MTDKHDFFLERVRESETHLLLDASQPGVEVPAHVSSKRDLVLKFSYRYEPADLSVDEWGVRQTLSFAGQPFTVAVPWTAVYGAGNPLAQKTWERPGRSLVWMQRPARA